MKSFALSFSIVIILLLYYFIEYPSITLSFVAFSLLLLENAFRLGAIAKEPFLLRIGYQDFRFRYAVGASRYLYSLSLIVAYTVFALFRFQLGARYSFASVLVYALLFVVFRVGANEVSSYLSNSRLVHSSDYLTVAAEREDLLSFKSDALALIKESMLLSDSPEITRMLEALYQAVTYSTKLDNSIIPLLRELSRKVSLADSSAAIAVLHSINKLT